MKSLSLADCYRILELPNGVPIPTVIDSWRVLSQIYHPDKHKKDSAAYHKALEKQKQLNNARDVLKKWIEKHPGQMPPRHQHQKTGGRSEPKQEERPSAKASQVVGREFETPRPLRF
jgi:DnaJ-class molecular chaperone